MTRRKRRGFTLIEILTALTVLSLIVIMLAQMLGTMSRSWKGSQRRVNNFGKARSMLDLMVRDLRGAVFRPDLIAFPANSVAFYTQSPGASSSSSTLRNVSLVQYAMKSGSTQSILQRGDLAIPWDMSSQNMTFGTTASLPLSEVKARDTAPGIVGFKILFLRADGTYTNTYTNTTSNPISAVSISLAVVDDQTIQLMSTVNSQKISDLQNGLANAISGNRSPRADWDDYLKTLDWKSYPSDLATGLKIFERYVYLPGTPAN